MNQEIAARLFPVIARIRSHRPEQIQPEHEFVEDLGYDALDLVELSIDIEDAFDIEVSDDEMAAAQSAGQAIELVARRLEAKGTKHD